MRRVAPIALALAAVVGLAACATRVATSASRSPAPSGGRTPGSLGSPSPARRQATIDPVAGGAGTVFTARFVASTSARPTGQLRVGYTVSVTGATGRGCLGTGSVQASAAGSGTLTSVALDPARWGSRWCPGRHVVRVVETGAPVCAPGTMCPQYVRVIGTVGETAFTVAR